MTASHKVNLEKKSNFKNFGITESSDERYREISEIIKNTVQKSTF